MRRVQRVRDGEGDGVRPTGIVMRLRANRGVYAEAQAARENVVESAGMSRIN